jgi:quercetin dioxygenase-like cupin family protein
MTIQPSASTCCISRATAAAAFDVFGVTCRVLLAGADSAGLQSVARLTCPPGAGAPPHRHAQAETFHILCGRLEVRVDETCHELGAGDLVHVRPWAVHAFLNRSTEPVEFIAIGAPAGHEHFFAEADALTQAGDFTPAHAAAVCGRHGIELVETP